MNYDSGMNLAAKGNYTEIIDHFYSRSELLRGGHLCCSSEMKNGLIMAAKDNYVNTAKILIQCPGIEVNKGYSSGITPLYIAARANHFKIVNVLLTHEYIDDNSYIKFFKVS